MSGKNDGSRMIPRYSSYSIILRTWQSDQKVSWMDWKRWRKEALERSGEDWQQSLMWGENRMMDKIGLWSDPVELSF